MRNFDLELHRITYEKAVNGLKNRRDLTMEQAVDALDVFCANLLQALLLHNEDSLQSQSQNSGWFIYQSSFAHQEQRVNLTIRTVDNTQPIKEIELLSLKHDVDDAAEQGHQVILRTNQLIPGVFHENLPSISIPMSDLAEGVEPDGEWVSVSDEDVTMYKQYPWQARLMLGSVLIETSPRFFPQTERKYSEKNTNLIGFNPFWRGKFENGEYVPAWNPHLAPHFFKQVRHYAKILKPIIFGKES
jgi:hypothetical protein